MKHKPRYRSPEVLQRVEAVKKLKEDVDKQRALVEIMSTGDGRTVEVREAARKSDLLEDQIQANLRFITNL